MQKNYTYDIALSFAVEDILTAKSISDELDRLGITNYFYPKGDPPVVGNDLKEQTWEVYRSKSMFALMLISENYIKRKSWADEERQVMQMVKRDKDIPYILPLRLDETKVEGLSSNIVFWKWNEHSNPSYVAISIFQMVKYYKMKQKDLKKKKGKKKNKKKSNKEQRLIQNIKGNVLGGVWAQSIGSIKTIQK